MTRSITRRAAALAGTAALALALAACTPPNENPSDVKVDTATEFQAPPADLLPAPSSSEPSSTATAPVEDGFGTEVEGGTGFTGTEPTSSVTG